MDDSDDNHAGIERLALRLLASREHSRLELERKLADRGHDPEPIARVLDRLEAAGALSEGRLAEAYVAVRIAKGFGPLRIQAELRGKGVSETVIETHLDAVAEDWPTRLAAAHNQRFGTDPPVDRADYGRRGRFLEQRGFSPEMIRRFLRWTD